MTYPTPAEIELITAFLGGYVEEGAVVMITLPWAVTVASRPVPGVEVDPAIAERILIRCGFRRSYLPADAGVITFRREL